MSSLVGEARTGGELLETLRDAGDAIVVMAVAAVVLGEVLVDHHGRLPLLLGLAVHRDVVVMAAAAAVVKEEAREDVEIEGRQLVEGAPFPAVDAVPFDGGGRARVLVD